MNGREKSAGANTRRGRAFGTALAELALAVTLVLAIAAVVAITGASDALATARSDLIMMEESAATGFTTVGIVAVIGVVMGVLAILALRDVAPAHSKRPPRRDARR